MTRPNVDTTERDLARRQRGVQGLALFDELRMREAEASAGLALDGGRSVPSVVVEGSGQKARKAARPGKATSAAKRHVLALLLEANGPMTRKEMAAATGWLRDSVNGRTREACLLPDGHEDKLLTDGHRGGESLVHLARKHSLTYAEG